MPRGLSSAVKSKLESGKFTMAHLVKLELNTTYKYTDYAVNIFDGSDTYVPNGFLRGIGAVSESASINIGSIDITVSSATQTILSDVLNNGHLNRNVTIKRAILDTDDSVVTSGTFQIYAGYIEGMSITDTQGDSVITFAVANHWSDFMRFEGRRTNDSSQQHFFNGDKTFEFTSQAGKKLYWGNVSIVTFSEEEIANWHSGHPDADVMPGTFVHQDVSHLFEQ
tara:strand:- start:2311 stop:2982 length:672 start_codon:yes stop_codon:yes gene_type:complete